MLQIPIALNDLALGVTGLGILWLNVAKCYDIEEEILYLLYLSSLLGAIFVVTFTQPLP